MDIQFAVAEATCSGCGLCVSDCPAHVLEMWEGHPRVAAGREDSCYRCQHCFAVCPGGAISVFGLVPEDSGPLPGDGPEPRQLEALVMGRRSVRHYQDQEPDPALVQHLLEVAWHAPSGHNDRQVLFTVVDDRAKLARLRTEVMAGIKELVRNRTLPEKMGRFAEFVRLWEEEGMDVLFRGAPHLVVASTPSTVVTPVPDCLIALSTFDLLAQANGLGTLWDGLATVAIQTLVPGVRETLGIPADHVIGYVKLFGKPAVRYARPAQRRPPLIRRMA
jgi:nitroreductase/NAD-dependent dihydropyrimidine dehydrogenase PreA subunit